MKSRKLNTTELNWDSLVTELPNTRASKTLNSLVEGGLVTLKNLVWTLPLRAFAIPPVRSFLNIEINQLFSGKARIINLRISPQFYRKTKFNLYNAFLVLKDTLSEQTVQVRFFNIYPNQKKQLESLNEIFFLGTAQEIKGQLQFINPKFQDSQDESWIEGQGNFLVDYPTINKTSGLHIKKLIDKIPSYLWETPLSDYPQIIDHPLSLNQAFQRLHLVGQQGKINKEERKEAIERVVYEEFFEDQLKVLTRKKFLRTKKTTPLVFSNENLEKLKQQLPFTLTDDQEKVLSIIQEDFSKDFPMMRMLQGDVGCGKTIIAFLAALMAIESGKQVAMMCPTEALALQHFESFKSMFPQFATPALILGSQKKKQRNENLKRLVGQESLLVIGTHALFQESISFHDLSFVIIDEQHKFGVEQRLSLSSKGQSPHCLIMSATPIPRTLSLSHFGDLDISTIRTMPSGRKGIKTRIVAPENYQKYLSFLKQRLDLGDQGYFVFPAIEESDKTDLKNVTESFEHYRAVFSQYQVAMLHGQMKSAEKQDVIDRFTQGKIQVLLSTSVIEVGISIPNACFISVYQPERFGLSSLHQLRGRVGRGEKPGFCFLVLSKDLSPESLERLEVIEKTINGFEIAEADLQFRGHGDLFGVNQSGEQGSKKIANFITHSHILEKVYQDTQLLLNKDDKVLLPYLRKLAQDQKILDTI